MIKIYHRHLDIFNLVVGRQGQYNQLYRRHHKYDPDNGRIAENLPEFLL